MQLEDIKTIEKAESLAYKQIMLLEQTKQNLAMLQARIEELAKTPTKKG